MQIWFDFELDETLPQAADPDSIGLRAIREFVYSRFRVFEDQVEKEREGKDPAVVILKSIGNKLGIQPINVPDPIRDKMMECFTEDDFAYLAGLLARLRDQE